MTSFAQGLIAAIAYVVLDVLHVLKVVMLVPLLGIYDLLQSTESKLAKFYDGKTVLVTGASSGVGEAMVLQLAGLRCNLVLCARSAEQLNRVAGQCRAIAPSSHVLVLPLDLEEIAVKPDGVSRVQSALESWLQTKGLKGVDVLLNVAGVSSRGSALETDSATLKKVMDVNFFGPAILTRSIIPLMVGKCQSPAIGVVSSVQGRLGIPLRTSYAASKHALQGYCDCLRAEMHKKVSVTVISPGYVNTNLSNNAITGDGSKYGKTDETTAKGMSPQLCARSSLLAVARGLPELVLADAKTCAAVQARGQFPGLLARMTRSKGT